MRDGRLHVDLVLHIEMNTAGADVADFGGVVAMEDMLNAEGPLFRVRQNLVGNEGRGCCPLLGEGGEGRVRRKTAAAEEVRALTLER